MDRHRNHCGLANRKADAGRRIRHVRRHDCRTSGRAGWRFSIEASRIWRRESTWADWKHHYRHDWRSGFDPSPSPGYRKPRVEFLTKFESLLCARRDDKAQALMIERLGFVVSRVISGW